MKPRFDPQELLPLAPVHLEILVCLAEGERHGYALKREIARQTEGRMKLGPGSLYGAIRKLTDDGLIEESSERPDSHLDDERRRYYRLTKEGQAVLEAESARLRALLHRAEVRLTPARSRRT